MNPGDAASSKKNVDVDAEGNSLEEDEWKCCAFREKCGHVIAMQSSLQPGNVS